LDTDAGKSSQQHQESKRYIIGWMDELPIVCDRGALGMKETARQRELWGSLVSDIVERRELEHGYSLKLPATRIRDAAELMDIERRCCGFLKLSLEAQSSEPHVWFTLSGPPGSKGVLDAELGRMLSPRNH
jgi:hypothetical protein